MDTTSPTPQVFTHTPRPPHVPEEPECNYQRWFLNSCSHDTASVVRKKSKNTAHVMLHEYSENMVASISRAMTPAELMTLARALIDAAADINANPAGGAL